MTSIPADIAHGICERRPIAPTRIEQLLLRVSHAVERYALRRMLRRAAEPSAATADAADARRTAQALGAVGILPR